MKYILAAILVLANACWAQEEPSQMDRVCIGRMLIVQAMQVRKDKGETQAEYMFREVVPYMAQWRKEQLAEVQAVINYVWSHDAQENAVFAGAVMEACYKQFQGS